MKAQTTREKIIAMEDQIKIKHSPSFGQNKKAKFKLKLEMHKHRE